MDSIRLEMRFLEMVHSVVPLSWIAIVIAIITQAFILKMIFDSAERHLKDKEKRS